jgi:hypothetical protein
LDRCAAGRKTRHRSQDARHGGGGKARRGPQGRRGRKGESVPRRRDRLPDGWEQGGERVSGTRGDARSRFTVGHSHDTGRIREEVPAHVSRLGTLLTGQGVAAGDSRRCFTVGYTPSGGRGMRVMRVGSRPRFTVGHRLLTRGARREG